MRLGPMSTFDLGRLRAILDRQGAPYEIEASKDDLEAYGEKRLEDSRHPNSRPVQSEILNYIYLEVPEASLEFIRDELTKLALWPSDESGEIPARTEWVCEKCDHVAFAPGNCPKHGRALIEFDSLVERRKEKSGSKYFWRYLTAAGLLALVATELMHSCQAQP